MSWAIGMTGRRDGTMDNRLFETLKSAYESSTISDNRFERVVKAIEWDDHFIEDDEHYFILGGFRFIVPSLNPFEGARPSAIFSDSSYLEF